MSFTSRLTADPSVRAWALPRAFQHELQHAAAHSRSETLAHCAIVELARRLSPGYPARRS